MGFNIFGGRARRTSRSRRGRDLEIAVDVTLEEAASGAEKTITIPRYGVCPTCSGSGVKPGTKKITCSQCKGSGRIVISSGFFQLSQSCPKCSGEGSIIQTPCPTCNGQGRTKEVHKLKVKIPPGVDTDSHLRIRGEGEAGAAGRGDLYVIIEVKQHPAFDRQYNDILTSVSISLTRAVLGGETEVPTLNGHVKMKIPPGTQSGKIFRLKGKGMPDLHTKLSGDELVRVIIEIPTRLTSEQRRLMEEFARLSGEDINAKASFTSRIKNKFR